jgi:hypothetical protein
VTRAKEVGQGGPAGSTPSGLGGRRAGWLAPVTRKGPPAWVVGGAGLLIAIGVVLQILIPNHMDPTVFLAFGEDSPVHERYARELLGDVITRPRGHDGKFFFIQANDPWYLAPERNAFLLDRPLYRGQRMLYPLIASGFGLFPPLAIAWGMLLTNVVALGVGAFVAAKLAARWGASTWLGLSVPLNIGLLYEVWIGGASVLGYVLCLTALYALTAGRGWTAAFLFTAAVLSRESMLVFVAGVFALQWLEERRFCWRLLITPVSALVLWQTYLRIRLMGISGFGAAWPLLAPPFVGLVQAFKFWAGHPQDILTNLVILALVLAFIPVALRSRLPIAWGALPFVVLATILSVQTWRESFDFTRALAPVFTAAAFLIFVRNADESDDRTPIKDPTREVA